MLRSTLLVKILSSRPVNIFGTTLQLIIVSKFMPLKIVSKDTLGMASNVTGLDSFTLHFIGLRKCNVFSVSFLIYSHVKDWNKQAKEDIDTELCEKWGKTQKRERTIFWEVMEDMLNKRTSE